MKKTLLLSFAALTISTGYSQSDRFWKARQGEVSQVTKSVQRESFPREFKLFDMNVTSLRQSLFSVVGTSERVIITLPNIDGKLERFSMFEMSNFDAELQAQYPNIRSFAGTGLDDANAQVRMSIDPRGIQTMVFRAGKSSEFMEPYSTNGSTHAVFTTDKLNGKFPFNCSTVEENLINDISGKAQQMARSNTGQLKTFRLALSCPGEYSNYFGATSAAQSGLVLAAFNATMTRVNGVFEKDLAIHLTLINQTTNVIYYNAVTDPYSDAGNGDPGTGTGGLWNGELQNTLTTVIGESNYDIGHFFGASGGGGNAGCIGCVCTDGQKGSAFTSPYDGVPVGDRYDIDYVAHEMGHQFGARHTFTHSAEDSTVNFEPGGGSTIMAYAGITAQNIAPYSDDYFHAGSIEQVQTAAAGMACATNTIISHGAPVVNAGADYTIPKGTPFMLTGSATDAGGGTLTYCWEQYDDANGASQLCSVSDATPAGDTDCVPAAGKTTGPAFRSYNPTTSPVRYFPNMATVLSGAISTAGPDIPSEFLYNPTSTFGGRTYNFRLTARDNVAGQGQTGFDNTVISVVANKGPLTVTSQNTDGIVWAQGSTQTITWTVNNTNTGTGGSANVDIFLSTDNGATFNTVLLANTPNDGNVDITVPNITAANCRIMVKASTNIFFNVNIKNIAIGDYTYQTVNECRDYSWNLNRAITEDSGGSYSGFGLSITDSYTITAIKYFTNITHPNIGQVNFLMAQPWDDTSSGLTTALLYNNTSCTSANLNKWFNTAGTPFDCAQTNNATEFRPYTVTPVNAGIGQNSAGTWGVYIKDMVVDGIAGTLNTFTIQLCYSALVPVLSNDSFSLDNFSIYPNPNKGNFNVQFNSVSGNEIKIGVHDMRGRLVFENAYQNTGTINQNVQLNNVQSGIYIVTVQDGEHKEVKKIVIE